MTEDQTIEYKATWRDECLKWICGFANAQGGVLEIGKDDRGRLVGLADAAKLLEDLPNKIRDILGIVPEVDRLTENGKDYLRITVQPYPNPISYKGQYHVRSGSTKQELKGSELDHFLLGKYGRRWDGVPLPGVKASDLDPKLLERFRRRAVHSRRLNAEDLPTDDTALLDMLRLTEGNYLKRAAVLLFHADPERFITGAFVKIGYFLNDAEIRYQDEVHGDLFTQVDQTVASIREHGYNRSVCGAGRICPTSISSGPTKPSSTLTNMASARRILRKWSAARRKLAKVGRCQNQT